MKNIFLPTICLLISLAASAQEPEVPGERIAGDYIQVDWSCEDVTEWTGEDYDPMGRPKRTYAYRYKGHYYIITGDYLSVYDTGKNQVAQFYDQFNNIYARYPYEIGEYAPSFFVPAKGDGPVFIIMESTSIGGGLYYCNGGYGARIYAINSQNQISEAGYIHVTDSTPYQPIIPLIEIRNIPEGQKITFTKTCKYTLRNRVTQILLSKTDDLYYICSEGKLAELGAITSHEKYKDIKRTHNTNEPYMFENPYIDMEEYEDY